jgi:uncharacterized protein
MSDPATTPTAESSKRSRFAILDRDDVAYVAPMASFLVLIWIGGVADNFRLYPVAYAARTVIAAGLLVFFWKHYTKIRWNHWWLGLIVGVIGIFQWVLMQRWLENHFSMFQPKPDAIFKPMEFFADYPPAMLWAFIAMRVLGAVLVVPVMEELFWRDFLWREIIAPNDFKLARVGEWDPAAFFVVAGAFATVHANWWPTAIVWGLMVGVLLVYTKSLGACIIAHATTNLLLSAYVLHYNEWSFW